MKTSTSMLALARLACLVGADPQEQAILSDSHRENNVPARNIAIIGAGAAGASAAYHLHKLAHEHETPINITIFERSSSVGGRSTTVHPYDSAYETVELGASIFVEVNKILVDAVAEFNLTTDGFLEARSDVPGPALGVWNGQEFVITQREGGTWWNTAKLLWRYGLAPVRTMNLMKSTTGSFFKMYDPPHFPFHSLSQVVYDLELTAVTSATGEQYLRDNGIGSLFADEIIQASTRVNYAQNLPYIHGLEAMVCMATDGAMSVQGGNWQIFKGMIETAKATTLLNTEVHAVEKKESCKYSVQASGVGSRTDVPPTPVFDAVILAAPHQFANLTFTPELRQTPDKIPYVQLHVTLFTSPRLPSPAFFNLPPNQPVPHVILTTLPPGESAHEGPEGVGPAGFFSISLLRAITNPHTGDPEYLYKIFSPQPVNDTFLSSFLHKGPADVGEEDVTWMYTKVWHSYPYAYPRVTFEEIQLDRNLWYTSGIESFISTMETSALMGKNVARLIADRWEEKNMDDAGIDKGRLFGQDPL